MHWVLQTNIYSEEAYETVLTSLRDLQVPLTVVKVIPFSGDLEAVEGDIPQDGSRAIILGSYTLSQVAIVRGWWPGCFLGNLDFMTQRKFWGERMLNHAAIVTAFGDVPFQREPFFLRPVHDTKAFSGLVCDWGYYTEWRDFLVRLPELADPVNDPLGINVLSLATPVMTCPKLEIISETRTWIVDGRVVTASGYKRGTIKRYSGPADVSDDVICFAQECADIWCPDRAFVLDVAETERGPRIVEVNSLNSAGFYRGDMRAVIMAIEEMV